MENHLKDFKVAVSWTETGTVNVKAVDIDSAIERVKNKFDIGLPSGEYVDESFQVDEEITRVTAEMDRR